MEFSKYGLVLGKCEYPFPYIFKLGTPKIKLNIKSKPIYNHEKIHFNQYKRDNFHIFKLIFSKQYRLECELEAYTEQIKFFNLKSLNSTQWIIKNIIDNSDFLKATFNHDFLINREIDGFPIGVRIDEFDSMSDSRYKDEWNTGVRHNIFKPNMEFISIKKVKVKNLRVPED